MTHQPVGAPGGVPLTQAPVVGPNGQLQTTVSQNAVNAQNGNLSGVLSRRVDGDYIPLTLTLRKPIVFNGVEYSKLVFREVGLSDLIFLEDNGESGETLKQVWARMAGGIPHEVFDDMPIKEVEIIKDFFTACMGGLLEEG